MVLSAQASLPLHPLTIIFRTKVWLSLAHRVVFSQPSASSLESRLALLHGDPVRNQPIWMPMLDVQSPPGSRDLPNCILIRGGVRIAGRDIS
ncbi:Hypothetical protein CINCED_3A002222 [Cinara cedri]|uniref:Uncharacterized protein n=1 Tax=Cinara cedri TaxID=506608 RepID=A0A5E4M7P6_9HEMI|nr:Hypothetical protein CINCED_3A002222 [Cinara cedri]